MSETNGDDIVQDDPEMSRSRKRLATLVMLGQNFIERQKAREAAIENVRDSINKMTDDEFDQLCQMCPEKKELLMELKKMKTSVKRGATNHQDRYG
jgi:hypothetical protein